MIILDEIKQEENYSHSLIVTYPRTIQISHGVYDNVIDMPAFFGYVTIKLWE